MSVATHADVASAETTSGDVLDVVGAGIFRLDRLRDLGFKVEDFEACERTRSFRSGRVPRCWNSTVTRCSTEATSTSPTWVTGMTTTVDAGCLVKSSTTINTRARSI